MTAYPGLRCPQPYPDLTLPLSSTRARPLLIMLVLVSRPALVTNYPCTQFKGRGRYVMSYTYTRLS